MSTLRSMDNFINRVREATWLWNPSDMYYRDNGKKEATWRKLAQEFNLESSHKAKIQWKKLRDSHREALRRRRQHVKETGEPMPPWKYEEAMKFVRTDFEIERERCAKIERNIDLNPTSSFNCDDSNTAEGIEDKSEESIPNLLITKKSPPSSPIMEDLEDHKDHNEVFLFEGNSQRQETKNLVTPIADNSRNLDVSSPNDALGHLFESLCQKTRSLPPHLQLRVQREVFNIVTKAEEEALTHGHRY